MVGIKKLEVSISIDGKEVELGELVQDKKKIYFKYASNFIASGLEISPFKMKLSKAILSAETTPFNGLFGVFNDSLPDGWGQLLLDRTLISRGTLLNQITPLDRLAYVGSKGMGALIYKPAIVSEYEYVNDIALDTIANNMNQVIAGASNEVLEELFNLGGSSGGARPKIFVGYHPITNDLIHGTEILPEGYEHWIIKFPAAIDPIDIANIEYAYYKMALDAGIEMNPCKLFNGKSGKQYFGTKRFDRENGKRLHVHSASGLLHDNFRFSSLDYGHLMDAAFRLEKHTKAYEKILRLATFNVYAHNRDDHSKNVAFIMDTIGNWKFAPAYDLTFSHTSHGMHSTMVAGESSNPGKKQLQELADEFSVKNFNVLLENVQNVIFDWTKYASTYGVLSETTRLIQKVINQKRV